MHFVFHTNCVMNVDRLFYLGLINCFYLGLIRNFFPIFVKCYCTFLLNQCITHRIGKMHECCIQWTHKTLIIEDTFDPLTLWCKIVQTPINIIKHKNSLDFQGSCKKFSLWLFISNKHKIAILMGSSVHNMHYRSIFGLTIRIVNKSILRLN